MKHITTFSFALLLSAAPLMAEPLLGTWKTHPQANGGFGHVKFSPCGGRICGTLLRSFDASGKEVKVSFLGRKIISEMKADGGGSYSKGKIWNPDEDKTYTAKLAIDGTKMTVKGCIAIACRFVGVWTRVGG